MVCWRHKRSRRRFECYRLLPTLPTKGVFCIKWLTQNPLRDFKQKGGVVGNVGNRYARKRKDELR